MQDKSTEAWCTHLQVVSACPAPADLVMLLHNLRMHCKPSEHCSQGVILESARLQGTAACAAFLKYLMSNLKSSFSGDSLSHEKRLMCGVHAMARIALGRGVGRHMQVSTFLRATALIWANLLHHSARSIRASS